MLRLTSRPIRSISSNGPIRKPPPRRHDAVDRRRVGDAVAEHPQRLQREGAGEAVGDEAGAVLGADRRPAHPLGRPRSPRPAPPRRSSSVATTSTSFISAGGLKKCMPTTRSGLGTPAAISVTRSEEVLVARIVSGPQTSASCGEQLALQLEVLGRRLDHQLAAGQPVELAPSARPAPRPPSASSSLQRPRAAPLSRASRSSAAPASAAVGDGVVEPRLVAAERGDLGDAAAHRAGADDADRGRRSAALELRLALLEEGASCPRPGPRSPSPSSKSRRSASSPSPRPVSSAASTACLARRAAIGGRSATVRASSIASVSQAPSPTTLLTRPQRSRRLRRRSGGR